MKHTLIIFLLLNVGCGNFQWVDGSLAKAGQDIKDSIDPTIFRGAHLPTAEGKWARMRSDREMGIIRSPLSYGITKEEEMRRLGPAKWQDLLVYDPLLGKHRPYRNEFEYLNGIQ